AGVALAPLPSSATPTSLTTTSAPRLARSFACARPRPPPAPVTIATLPSNPRSAIAPDATIALSRRTVRHDGEDHGGERNNEQRVRPRRQPARPDQDDPRRDRRVRPRVAHDELRDAQGRRHHPSRRDVVRLPRGRPRARDEGEEPEG